MDRDVVLEGLSTLLGVPITAVFGGAVSKDDPVLTTKTFLSTVWFGHNKTTPGDTTRLRATIVSDVEFFDPQYDCDFTTLTDSSTCERGGESYKRPLGWKRIALKVKGKYEDDIWLGPKGWRSNSARGEWPVSFHGTTKEGATGIIRSWYKAGPREKYGRGVYSTPDIDVAVKEGFAKTFTSKTTGKTYMILLQNRINPEYRKICTRKEFWLVPVKEGTSAEREKDIVTSAIRPYGVLLKEMKE